MSPLTTEATGAAVVSQHPVEWFVKHAFGVKSSLFNN